MIATGTAPWVEVLAGAVDDYTVRLGLGGGVVQDCTPAQARGLAAELVEAADAAERCGGRERFGPGRFWAGQPPVVAG